MSSLYEAKLLKNKKWKTIEALTRFSLCKPNIIYGRRHNRTYVQFRYKTNTHLTCHHFLDSSVTHVFAKPNLKHVLSTFFRIGSVTQDLWNVQHIQKSEDLCHDTLPITFKLKRL